MKRLIVVILAAVVVLWGGCDNLGEDPFPSPGPNPDGSVTLFVNGSLYNFDYTAQYDGIQLLEYMAPTPDGKGGVFSSISSSAGGGFSGSIGSIYDVKGDKAMEFSHDIPNNWVETWRITLFDDPSMSIYKVENGTYNQNYTRITFWAKYALEPVPRMNESGVPYAPVSDPSVIIRAETKNGYTIADDVKRIFSPEQKDSGEWVQFSVPLAVNFLNNPPDHLKYWSIKVPTDAGRIYIDEIVLQKN